MKAHRARRDESEQPIIRTLEACGWTVQKLAQRGVPDLLLFKGGIFRVAECKTGKRKLRATQQWTDFPVDVFRSEQDVLDWNQQQAGETRGERWEQS